MSDYIRLVDIEDKVIYDLGKAVNAKYYLPYFSNKLNGKSVVLFGDETHCWCEDIYNTYEYNSPYKEVSFETLKYDNIKLSIINMHINEFYKIFNEIGGKEINNLNDYIKNKYIEVQHEQKTN